MAKILITGGSGLVGQALTALLLAEGHEIRYFSTRKNYKKNGVSSYHWDLSSGSYEVAAMQDLDYIVHLAGANVAGGRWTAKRKKEIYDSRILSTKLLVEGVKEHCPNVKAFIGASAIGIYEANSKKKLQEDSPLADDFLAKVCKDWEQEMLQFETQNIRTVIMRTGIVLSTEGGAYKEMAQTLPFFVASLGGGEQIYSWLHIEDMAKMYVHALFNNEVKGIYNAVAPHPVSQKKIAREIAKDRIAPVIPAPAFNLKMLLGDMAKMVLNGHDCSADKLLQSGFQFAFPKIEEAVADLKK